jgi:hypothetical protein
VIEAAPERPADLALALDLLDDRSSRSGIAVGAEPTAVCTGKYPPYIGAPSQQKATMRRTSDNALR